MSLQQIPAKIRREIPSARLPENYTHARTAISQCMRIDECQEWANKAEAIASYARQLRDRSMMDMAKRISLRARSRIGELLLEIPIWNSNGRGSENKITRASVGRRSGLTDHEIHKAISIAKVPSRQREELIETSPPVSLTHLVRIGERETIVRRRAARGQAFQQIMIDGHGNLGHFWRWTSRSSPVALSRQLEGDEAAKVLHAVKECIDWLDEFEELLQKRSGVIDQTNPDLKLT